MTTRILDILFKTGWITAVHNHPEDDRGEGYCPGCHEEEVRRS